MSRRTFRRTVKRLRVTVASAEEAVRGNVAYANPADGTVVADPAGVTTLIPLGYFTEDMTGDGTLTTLVDLFSELSLHGFDNDAGPNDVQAGDIFSDVYAVDGTTVSTSDGTGSRSVAGRALILDAEDGRVYVLPPLA